MTESADRFSVRFWGVRGSIPSPGPTTVRFGGNTSCTEVWCGDSLFVLDAGSGLRPLGAALNRRKRPITGRIFLAHLHWDHIQGIPFFSTAYMPGNQFEIYGCRRDGISLRENLIGQMTHPNFPVPITVMQSKVEFHEIGLGDTLTFDDVTVRTAQLNHPGGSMGCRIEYRGRALAYCTDHEHESDRKLHPGLEELARGADVLIYDATYTADEYPAKMGWGHSTWEVGCESAVALGVKRLVIFHHDPEHADDDLDVIEAAAAEVLPGTCLAREGLEIDIFGIR